MKSAYKVFSAFVWSFLMVACNGGGDISQPSESNLSPSSETIAISLIISSQFIDASSPAIVTATVTSSESGLLSGELVTFILNDTTLGAFNPGTGTAITNAEGIATIELVTSNIAGAGVVEVNVRGGETVTVGFNMAGDGGEVTGGAVVVVILTDATGATIGSITSIVPGRITATVSGINKPSIVIFTSTIGDLPITSAVTDSDGKASVDLYAGSALGAGTVTATLSSGEVGETVVVIGATNVVMGSGDPFIESQASLSVTELSAGGTASISVTIEDDEGNLFTQPVDVNFTSTCSTKSVPEAEISSPVPSVNGVATTTYLAQGCVGLDNINVTANAGGLTLSATGSITVLASSVGSIVFESSAPERISILGTGGDESSVIKFKVLDTNSDPVSNQAVSFFLNISICLFQLYAISLIPYIVWTLGP